MDIDQPESHPINEANCPLGTNTGDSLLITLEKGSQEKRGCRNHHGGLAFGDREEGKRRPEEIKKDKKGNKRVIREQKEKVVEVLKELNEFHAETLTGRREVTDECVCILKKFPPGVDEDHDASTKDVSEYKTRSCSVSDGIFLSVGKDMEELMDGGTKINPKPDAAVLRLSTHEESAAVFQEPRDEDDADQTEDIRNQQSEYNLEFREEVRDAQDQKYILDSGCNSSNCSMEKETEEKTNIAGQEKDFYNQVSSLEAEEKYRENKTKWRTEEKWVTTWCDCIFKVVVFLEAFKCSISAVCCKSCFCVCSKTTLRLRGGTDGSDKATNADKAPAPGGRFIRAPAGALTCEAADALSCLVASGSEELISRVIRVKVQDRGALRYPVTVAVPFCVRHRGGHREVAVKVVEEEKRVSYITPVTTEEVHGGQKGRFAEVKVFSLGIFAVVSRPKREMYNIPRKGLSLKIPMDPRICLNYLPGSFTAPVMAQTMVQPVDTVLLAAVKSGNDAYESVVSASPLLHLTHPNSQPLRRPLTITLPCPPNSEKKEEERRKESKAHQVGAPSDPLIPSGKARILGAYVRSNETSNELLIVLGSRDKQWIVLDKIIIRNQKNGLVTFDLIENSDRLLVVRLLSPLQPCHLIALAEELEASACRHSVTVVLQHGRDDPHSVLLAALPSRDLSWELNRLRAGGAVETSAEISLCEGDQLLLRFSGNITSTAFTQSNTSEESHERLTFHCQRRSELLVRLTEVDPFGNYSSPCYKGTALFYRVTRAELEWRGDKAVLRDAKLLANPVCKLPLSLPKKVRVIHRPIATRVKISEDAEPLSDALLVWLSGELSPEETSLLASSLRLSRSAAQLVKLRSRDNPSDQAFHVLAMWRRALPAVTRHPKASQLAQSLGRIGRPELAREVLLREAELSAARSFRK
ncbi:death domain-containing protein 1 [Poeciliopsis prolifica]|uniref:death domain-containing protein 1 n=1 Tax=Poeciliopsis prolifica TaxID=188132 RepID=UPI0024146872|nr:death domain-containing protein 1 [Poeciliopsis prolifica]